MDYNESLVYKELLENSKIIADNIMRNIRRLGLRFTLDELKLGDGNCFFRGILQQCKREEIYSSLPDEVKPRLQAIQLLVLCTIDRVISSMSIVDKDFV